MPDLVADFCTWSSAYNGISEARAKAQEVLLRRLPAVESLTPRDLELFLASGDFAPSTTLKHLKMIRPFLKWCWRHGHITADQYMSLKEVRAPRGAGKGAPRPYSIGEMQRFWRAFETAFPWTADEDPYDRTPKRGEYWVNLWLESGDDWYYTRHVYTYARRLQAEAVVALALFGGLRRIEMFQLAVEDAHYENAYVRVDGARKNEAGESLERAVPVTEQMRAALANWIEFRGQVLKPEHDRMFLSLWREGRLNPISFTAFAHLLDSVGELHRLRHTYATERLRARMPVEVLQKILGHANIAMTLRYAQIGAEDVVRVAAETDDKFEAALAGGRDRGDEDDGKAD